MNYIHFTILITLILGAVLVSGCTEMKAENGTWGEKEPVKASELKIVNSTGEHFDRNETSIYYVYGDLKNTNGNDAYNVGIKAKFFDAEGNLVGTNTSGTVDPSTVVGEGTSFYYAGWEDPDKRIVRAELKIVVKN
ncbi:MAG: FxLYD domain-containing protein [Methanobacteriaceae archaeon]|nr:FxLYD domain-containing protein [Methanobacteriaceae archaeon]